MKMSPAQDGYFVVASNGTVIGRVIGWDDDGTAVILRQNPEHPGRYMLKAVRATEPYVHADQEWRVEYRGGWG